MRVLLTMAKLGVTITAITVIFVTISYFLLSSSLPDLSSLRDYQPPLVTRVYNTQGGLVAEYATEHRIITPLNEIPAKLKNAFLAAEDEHFYTHPGINPARIMAAALANLQAGHTVQGGSTITQQVAKNFLLSSERSYSRKLREIVLAYRIEQAFSKDEILFLYLNQIFLGRGAYGVTSAAWRYYHKRLDQLTLAECAMLAGLPKAPSKYGPHLNNKLATDRRNTVLSQMAAAGFVTAAEAETAKQTPNHVAPLTEAALTDALGSELYDELSRRYGEESIRNNGMTILVSSNPAEEQAAVKALRKGLYEIETRQYYRPPVNHPANAWPALLAKWGKAHPAPAIAEDEIVPALVQSVGADGSLKINDGRRDWQLAKPKWQWLKPAADQPPLTRPATWQAGDQIWLQGTKEGSVRLMQQPSVEGSLYSIDLKHGVVLAEVGGYNFHIGDFNRVVKAQRQPGSAFKPFIYAVAMENGYTPASIVMDTPLVFEVGAGGEAWSPDNYKDEFGGPVTVRDALEHSRNMATIRLLQDLGVDKVQQSLKNYAFNREFPRDLSIALGSTEVSLKELTESYLVLASNGERWSPVLLQQVQDRSGRTRHRSVAGNRCQVCHVDPVLAASPGMKPSERTMDPVTSFLTLNMMKGVIERGTGAAAAVLRHPAAGKTGTTNDQLDAWFMGFTAQVLTGVWVGRDTPSPMGRQESGARAALPIWLEAMQAFHKERPVVQFTVPEGVTWGSIDRKSGQQMAEGSGYQEAFRAGTEPGSGYQAISADPYGYGSDPYATPTTPTDGYAVPTTTPDAPPTTAPRDKDFFDSGL